MRCRIAAAAQSSRSRPRCHRNRPELGEHLRKQGQRLDHLANYYLSDPNGFWRVAEINDAVLPDAVLTQDVIKIPARHASMGFGAIIATGDNNELLSEELMDCVTEIRVEQSLDEPTRFAIRFQEDIEDGEPRVMQSSELQCEEIITIAVEQDGALVCLVRGPIPNASPHSRWAVRDPGMKFAAWTGASK
jgi:hypothetical protein